MVLYLQLVGNFQKKIIYKRKRQGSLSKVNIFHSTMIKPLIETVNVKNVATVPIHCVPY